MIEIDDSNEVVEWLTTTLRNLMERPDLVLDDERRVWNQATGQHQTIITGFPGGVTITAEAVMTDECRTTSLAVLDRHRECVGSPTGHHIWNGHNACKHCGKPMRRVEE